MAISIIRKITKWVFLSLNILCCLLFLLSCLSLYISPAEWAPVGFLALTVPYLVIILFFYIIFWLIAKPKMAIISAVVLAIGWKQVVVIAAWHPAAGFKEVKAPTSIRIVSWNVRGLYGISTNFYTQQRNRKEIADLINKSGADVVCLQEFNNIFAKEDPNYNNIGLFTKTYPYYYFSKDFKNDQGTYYSGVIIFSRYKILNEERIAYKGKNPESLIRADLLAGNDTITVFTTHLQSFAFSKEDYRNIEKIKQTDDEVLEASENIYTKMKGAFYNRADQAQTVKNTIAGSTHPSVICGDFNDVPNSYTYFHIRGERQDAFLKSSFGIGRTFNALAPTLRIDYILPDNNFEVKQFELVDEGLSDHHLLMADLSLKK
ncbi:endonuclease/exonuclease/phosphatase family protein [Panacibacter sp. DH6]|uniref:Endonuclease/exonuclease/phosphatase family protein n=1 Tax=Panacibacter microcysteis TaxID=2793269 RepID=A0A931DZ73_9BACT|nr:endonuclease/exonuclease/phosphatase family protein [Panacibacter microcysteis]MBG9375652.1 endonuclease/exonuclease/phosphatase family protein [Panacibacter microcysteis]